MSETKGHDPMCPATQPVAARHRPACQCDLIADIRADEREQIANGGIKRVADRTLADLRAKVLGLPRVTDDYYREAVLLADVLLALLPAGVSE